MMKTSWSVVVVYEDIAGRQKATHVCDHLVQRFWAGCEFQVDWWTCAMLDQSDEARIAAGKAAEADLIIFALLPEGELPISVTHWVETWIQLRSEREGALVDLSSQEATSSEVTGDRQMYLRSAAHRGGMDYLTHEPQNISWCLPDSLDSMAARAERGSSVLDDILHVKLAPPAL
jgi:hypothetical protein